MTTAAEAVGLVSQGTAGMPASDRSQFTTPNCSLNMYRMKMDTDAADSTRGKKKVERRNTLCQDGILAWSMEARLSAMPSSRMTATTTNTMVFRNDTRTVGSCAREAKLAKPTNWGAEMMSQRKKARISEP